MSVLNNRVNSTLKGLAMGWLIACLFVTGCSSKKTDDAPLTPEAATQLNQTLNNLKLGMTADELKALLGEPALAEKTILKLVSYKIVQHATPRKIIQEKPYTEYLYVLPAVYVQALADADNAIKFYSITTRRKDFTPSLNTALDEPVQLGKQVYQSVQKKPFKVAARLDVPANQSAYYEIYPPKDKIAAQIILSSNPYGYLESMPNLDERKEGYLVTRITDEDAFPIHALHDAFRRSALINTFSTATADFEGVDLTRQGINFGSMRFGPNDEQIKKLAEGD